MTAHGEGREHGSQTMLGTSPDTIGHFIKKPRKGVLDIGWHNVPDSVRTGLHIGQGSVVSASLFKSLTNGAHHADLFRISLCDG